MPDPKKVIDSKPACAPTSTSSTRRWRRAWCSTAPRSSRCARGVPTCRTALSPSSMARCLSSVPHQPVRAWQYLQPRPAARQEAALEPGRDPQACRAQTMQKGAALVPLSVYFSGNYAKMQIGVGRGKKAVRQARGAQAEGRQARDRAGVSPKAKGLNPAGRKCYNHMYQSWGCNGFDGDTWGMVSEPQLPELR